MAFLNAKNYKRAYADNPTSKIDTGEVSGEIKFAYDEYTFPANAFTSLDVIKTSLRVTKGSKIIDAGILCPALGAGAFSLGRAAIGAAAAVPASLIAATSFAAANIGKPTAAAVDLMNDIVENEVMFDLTCTTTVTTGNGLTVKVWIQWCDV